MNKNSQSAKGIAFALAAYLTWGLFPLYWRLLHGISASEILTHRILWASLFFLILLKISLKNRFKEGIRAALPHLQWLILTAILISINWFTYIFAVNSGQILEASLGYFINPLVSILLGRIFLHEKLSGIQKISVGLALLGVGQLAVNSGHFPFIALTLAFSFGTYGLIRKQVPLPPLVASTIESLVMVGPASLFLLFSPSVLASQAYSAQQWLLLLLGGAVTALPLLWFAEAGKLLELGTVGFFQYITPTLQFLLAVFFFEEAFTPLHFRSFMCIWIGLALFIAHLYRSNRAAKKSHFCE